MLGVGATVTLAAWNDSEVASGSFAASTFATVSRGNGDAGYADHSSTAATLDFAAGGMSPGSLAYATLDVKTTPATNVAGTALLQSAAIGSNTNGVMGALHYRAVVIGEGASCNAAAVASAAFVEMNQVPPGLSAGLAIAGGSPVRFCFQVEMKSTAASSVQGGTGTVTWTVTSTSAM